MDEGRDDANDADVIEEVIETVAPSAVTDGAHDALRDVVERLETVVSRLQTTAASPAEDSDPANDDGEDKELDHTPVTVPWTHRSF